MFMISNSFKSIHRSFHIFNDNCFGLDNVDDCPNSMPLSREGFQGRERQRREIKERDAKKQFRRQAWIFL